MAKWMQATPRKSRCFGAGLRMVLLAVPWACLFAAGSASNAAWAGDARFDSWADRMVELFRIERRIRATQPRRRDGPLRELGISDSEVRQVLAASGIDPSKAAVNIGSVVTGCDCEDGPGCKFQVWLVAQDEKSTTERLMSNINDEWVIGPLQKWWIEQEQLERKRKSFPDYRAYGEAVYSLELQFPACSLPAADTDPSARRHPEK
jgi:hypothetical protein